MPPYCARHRHGEPDRFTNRWRQRQPHVSVHDLAKEVLEPSRAQPVRLAHHRPTLLNAMASEPMTTGSDAAANSSSIAVLIRFIRLPSTIRRARGWACLCKQTTPVRLVRIAVHSNADRNTVYRRWVLPPPALELWCFAWPPRDRPGEHRGGASSEQAPSAAVVRLPVPALHERDLDLLAGPDPLRDGVSERVASELDRFEVPLASVRRRAGGGVALEHCL